MIEGRNQTGLSIVLTTPVQVSVVRRPLLVVDGDSFAHRAYHGLPKSIRRAGGHGGRAIVLAFLLIGIETRGRTIEELDAPLVKPAPVKAAAG